MDQSSFEETILKKLEHVCTDQEQLLKQLQAMSSEPVKTIEEAVEKTLAKVNTSQLATIEKVNNAQSQLEKILGSHCRLNHLQNELKTEITNRTFLQNELSKDLEGLNEFVKSGGCAIAAILLSCSFIELCSSSIQALIWFKFIQSKLKLFRIRPITITTGHREAERPVQGAVHNRRTTERVHDHSGSV